MYSVDKIKQSRKLYIMQNGKEPRSAILGYEIIKELKSELPNRYIYGDSVIFGMKILVDRDKPTRVEVGNVSA